VVNNPCTYSIEAGMISSAFPDSVRNRKFLIPT